MMNLWRRRWINSNSFIIWPSTSNCLSLFTITVWYSRGRIFFFYCWLHVVARFFYFCSFFSFAFLFRRGCNGKGMYNGVKLKRIGKQNQSQARTLHQNTSFFFLVTKDLAIFGRFYRFSLESFPRLNFFCILQGYHYSCVETTPSWSAEIWWCSTCWFCGVWIRTKW